MTNPDEFSTRLDQLERELRRSKRVALSFGLIIAVLLGAGAIRKEDPKAVEATRFTLLDDDGRTRATLQLSPEGRPVLLFVDKEGKVTNAVPWENWDTRKRPFLPPQGQ